MKKTKSNGGGTPQGAHKAASTIRTANDPSARPERATGRLCAALYRAGGGRGDRIREWHPEQGFPTANQMSQIVAAEVRAQVEAAFELEDERDARRKRLREVYRRHSGEGGKPVDFGAVRNLIENAAAAIYAAWREISQLDHIALAEVGSKEDFDDLGFLVNRSLSELNGLKNAITLARRLA